MRPCRFVTVDPADLPDGHDFVIVRDRASDELVVFVAPRDRAQLEARIAVLEW